MRLWHYDLISYLPNSQLIAQKRECDLILKNLATGKKINHILINYVKHCDVKDLHNYYLKLRIEFDKRGFNFNVSPYYVEQNEYAKPFKDFHDDLYLVQCFYNLQEKFVRGQKDFSWIEYKKMKNFVKGKVDIYE